MKDIKEEFKSIDTSQLQIKHKNMFQKYILALAVILVAMLVTIFFQNYNKISSKVDKIGDQRVITAKELIDSWRGESSKLEDAYTLITDTLEDDPNNVYAKKELARYILAKGFINSKWVSNQTHVYQVGNYQNGTLEHAASVIKDALRINPEFGEGYVMLAHIKFEQNKLHEVESNLAMAEVNKADDPWLHLNWAALYIARGEYVAAIQRCEYVLQNYPDDEQAITSAYSYMLDQYIRDANHNKVIEIYKKLVKKEPNNAWLRGNYASYLCDYMGQSDEAIEQARKALEIMDYGIGRRILASALYSKWANLVLEGNHNSPEKYFQEAQQYYPYLDLVMAYDGSMPAGNNLVKALSTVKGISINARADDGSTALLIATNRNRYETVKHLLELHADPNISDNIGWTPLLSAADEGNTDIVLLLLDHGADLNVTMGGKDAAAFAESRGNTELADLLGEYANKHE